MIKMLQIVNGEMIITDITYETDKDYTLSIPLTIIPIPPEKSGGVENQIGFMKSLMFSDYSKMIKLNKSNVISISIPENKLIDTYNDFVEKFKAKQAGILTPTPQETQEVLGKKKIDFSKLNIGGRQ